MYTHTFRTLSNGATDVTAVVRDHVAASAVEEGIVVVQVPHTTAGVAIIAHPDPLVLDDLQDELARLVPTRIDFRHEYDTPQDAAGHIKSALFGTSVAVIVTGGGLRLGSSQKLYFLEYDGPRDRRLEIQVVGA